MNETEPLSPCISICHLDDQDICQGCYRSAREIADWLMVGAQEKRDILQRATARHESANTQRLK